MIDLHAHVLPGIDDGPATLADSLALLGAMDDQGVTTVIAGAHTLDGKYNATKEAVLAATELVNAELRRAGRSIVVLPGMELYLGFDLLRALRSGDVFGLNRSRHILVELPHREFPMYTERALFEVMIAGFRPILNHPERNAEIRRRPELMYRLAEKGVYAMVTAASLLGRFGAECQALAEEFVAEGAAPYIVSDAHNLKGRAPLLAEGLVAARAFGKVDQAAELSLLS